MRIPFISPPIAGPGPLAMCRIVLTVLRSCLLSVDVNPSISYGLKGRPSLTSSISSTTMSASRVTFAAAHTPEQEDFPYHDAFSRTQTFGQRQKSWHFSHGNEGERWRPVPHLASVCRRTREVVDANRGLLLVTASQACLAAVNTTVKRLNSIDPPVSTLEVRG